MAVDEDAAAALRRVGVKEADIEAALAQEADAQEADAQEAQEPDVVFEVHEDNWQSLLFFLRVQTQWVYFGIGGSRAGLNNTAVESTMRMARVKRVDQDALLADLQVMEREILKSDAERAAKAA